MAAKITEKERHIFIENMFAKLENITVESIVSSRIPLKHNGRHLLGLCPFHNDTHLGSFLVTPDRGIWKCFACGDGYAGNGIKFISLYDGIDYLQAAFKVALEKGIITYDEYSLYSQRQNYSESYIKKIAEKYDKEKKSSAKPLKMADIAIRHNVYHVIKDACQLSDQHMSQLKEERKLSDERINADYFTFPCLSWEKNNVIKKIREEYPEYTDEVLMTVPGFYYDRTKKKIAFYAVKGIGMLIHDVYGRVAAIQIRRDTIKEGQQRYIWFSSSFAPYEPDKYIGGTGCGSPRDILYPANTDRSILCITEGRFKSEVIRDFGNVTISLQGVGSQKGLDSDITEIMKELPIKSVFLMFDADSFGNTAVFLQLEKLICMLQGKFPSLKIRVVCWRKEYGKGIDDLYHNGKIKTVKYIESDLYVKTYRSVLSKILKSYETESLSDLKKLSLEEKKSFEDNLQQAEESIFLQ